MVVSHTGSKPVQPDWNIFRERTTGFSKIKNAVTGEVIAMKDFEIKPGESFVFELIK